jgi:hypothetical protein
MSIARDSLKSLSRRLEWLAVKVRENAFLVFGASAAVTTVVVVFLHWIQAVGLSSDNAFLAALPVGVAATVAMVCWALLLRLFWQALRDPNQSRYALRVVLSIVMICVSLEAFAGLSTLLWQRGLIQSATSGPASLWRAEGHYIWHLVSSVPLLSVPQTLDWRDPQPFVDHISGVLLLTFKFAIIAPLVRLGLSGYQFFEARRGRVVAKREIQREKELMEPGGKVPPTRKSSIQGGWALLILIIALSITVPMAILPNKASWIDHWLARLPPEVGIGNVHLPLGWLHAAPLILIAIVLIINVGNVLASLYDDVNPDLVRSMRDAAVAILAYFLLLALLTVTAAAISLSFLHLGAATSRPEIPPASQALATLNAYAWTIADSLPGPNIPATLNWTLQYRFVDHWSEVLLLTYKIIFYAVLLFPIYRIVRIYMERSRRGTPVEPSLSAALKYRDRLLDVQAALDRLEGRNVTSTHQKEYGSSPYPAKLALDDLESELEKVRSLFGETDVTSYAGDAEVAARKRFERSAMGSYGRSTNPEKLRSALNDAIVKYSQSATKALYHEGVRQFYRTE